MGAAERRLAVRFDEEVWREAVRGFSRRPLEIATSAWVFTAFGPRHPRAGVRSVYERAHRQLYGRFPERQR